MPNYATVCKIDGCGKPRLHGQTLALCDEHYLEYHRRTYWNGKAKNKKRRDKFTPFDVMTMRRLRREGWSLKQLAAHFDTSVSYVSEICVYRAWRWVA